MPRRMNYNTTLVALRVPEYIMSTLREKINPLAPNQSQVILDALCKAWELPLHVPQKQETGHGKRQDPPESRTDRPKAYRGTPRSRW